MFRMIITVEGEQIEDIPLSLDEVLEGIKTTIEHFKDVQSFSIVINREVKS